MLCNAGGLQALVENFKGFVKEVHTSINQSGI